MASRADIQRFANEVARRFRPASIMLFGSHAYGKPTEDSDVDLLVVMSHHGSSARAASRIRLACPRAFPMDLLVRSPAEIARRLRIGDAFMGEVMKKGVVLYESRRARVG